MGGNRIGNVWVYATPNAVSKRGECGQFSILHRASFVGLCGGQIGGSTEVKQMESQGLSLSSTRLQGGTICKTGNIRSNQSCRHHSCTARDKHGATRQDS